MAWGDALAIELRAIIGEAVAGNWSDAVLTAILKRAETDMVLLGRLYHGTFAQNIVAGGTGLYDIHADCLQIERVSAFGVPLFKKSTSQLIDIYGEEWCIETGAPVYYIIEGSQVRLVPISDTAETTTSIATGLVMWGIKRPDQSSTVWTPEKWYDTLLDGAAAKAYKKDPANVDRFEYFQSRYLDGIDNIVSQNKDLYTGLAPRNTTPDKLAAVWDD